VDYRVQAGFRDEVGALRISFLKTLHVVKALWQFLELSADMISPRQSRLLVHRALRQIADMAIVKRRARSCPRALRQPVSSWPRLRKNIGRAGAIQHSVGTIYA